MKRTILTSTVLLVTLSLAHTQPSQDKGQLLRVELRLTVNGHIFRPGEDISFTTSHFGDTPPISSRFVGYRLDAKDAKSISMYEIADPYLINLNDADFPRLGGLLITPHGDSNAKIEGGKTTITTKTKFNRQGIYLIYQTWSIGPGVKICSNPVCVSVIK